jgi:hypothetical protein
VAVGDRHDHRQALHHHRARRDRHDPRQADTYVCQGGGVLAGFTHRITSTWTIWYATRFGSKHLTLVTIADAWLR